MQLALIILDGWGHREEKTHNAIKQARTPCFDSLWNTYPHTLLEASGEAVGLPQGQMGNSEIGHTTIGAGTALDTDLLRIARAIDNQTFHSNETLVALFEHCKKHNSTLHVMGLVSDGGVHSHQDHLHAFLHAAKKAGIKKLAIHAFTDGRDTPPQSAGVYLKKLEDELHEIGVGYIATVCGRFYAMDRDNNWDRMKRAEDAMFLCDGNTCAVSASAHLSNLYAQGKLDEHIEPIVCMNSEGKTYPIQAHDGIFIFNFRADRTRMITECLIQKKETLDLHIATLTEYNKEYNIPVVFKPKVIETTLAKEISEHGLAQVHIAETEKFPHATYFLNGGVEAPYKGETHVMLDSRKDVPTHDLAPKMRAEGIADKAIEAIQNNAHFIFINFANPDMVGHTAHVPAIIEAVEEVDLQLNRIITALKERGGVAIITADHGNAEVNVDETTGKKHTAHTTNPVPFIYVANTKQTLKNTGTLADIAPTILEYFGIQIPKTMTGTSLLIQ